MAVSMVLFLCPLGFFTSSWLWFKFLSFVLFPTSECLLRGPDCAGRCSFFSSPLVVGLGRSMPVSGPLKVSRLILTSFG